MKTIIFSTLFILLVAHRVIKYLTDKPYRKPHQAPDRPNIAYTIHHKPVPFNKWMGGIKKSNDKTAGVRK